MPQSLRFTPAKCRDFPIKDLLQSSKMQILGQQSVGLCVPVQLGNATSPTMHREHFSPVINFVLHSHNPSKLQVGDFDPATSH